MRDKREVVDLWGARLAEILSVPLDAIQARDVHLVDGGSIVHVYPVPAGAVVDHAQIEERLIAVAPNYMLDPNSATDHFVGLIPVDEATRISRASR